MSCVAAISEPLSRCRLNRSPFARHVPTLPSLGYRSSVGLRILCMFALQADILRLIKELVRPLEIAAGRWSTNGKARIVLDRRIGFRAECQLASGRLTLCQ